MWVKVLQVIVGGMVGRSAVDIKSTGGELIRHC